MELKKVPNTQDLMEFDKIIIPFAIVGYEIAHIQLKTTPSLAT